MMKFACALTTYGSVLSLAVGGTAAMAQPQDSGTIVISVPQHAKLAENQRLVNFRDLPLHRQAGQTMLLHRVGYAIETLCESSVASSNPVGAMKCSNTAWNDVRPQLERLLKR